MALMILRDKKARALRFSGTLEGRKNHLLKLAEERGRQATQPEQERSGKEETKRCGHSLACSVSQAP